MQIKLAQGERGATWLPVKLIEMDDDAYIAKYGRKLAVVNVRPGGYAEAIWRGWGAPTYALNDYVRDALREYFASRMPRHDYYWRGTYNRKEIELIKSGELRPSINHADGTREAGLSVADHLGYVMMSGYRYGYRVRGTIVGRGSDGEPVLALDSLQPLDVKPRTIASIKAREEKQYFAARREMLKREGWTEEQYLASMWACVVHADRFQQYVD